MFVCSRVSHTTRKPYKEETAGKDYHFVTEEKFEMDIKMVMTVSYRLLTGSGVVVE